MEAGGHENFGALCIVRIVIPARYGQAGVTERE